MAINQQQMAQDLDYVSFDNYPVWGRFAGAEPIREDGARPLTYAARSKQGKPFG